MNKNKRTYMIFTGNGQHLFWVTRKDILFACGDNGDGQLGIGIIGRTNLNFGTKVDFFGPGKGKKIKEIATGYYHTIFLTEKGVTFGCGNSDEGMVVSGHFKPGICTPELCQFQKEVKRFSKIRCGCYTSYALTDKGECFTSGFNTYGELCLGHSESQNVWNKVTLISGPVEDIRGGDYFTIVLTKEGTVFGAGGNSYRQCGLIGKAPIERPTEIVSLRKKGVSTIACSTNSTFFLCKTGQCYVSGSNCSSHGKVSHDSAVVLSERIHSAETVASGGNILTIWKALRKIFVVNGDASIDSNAREYPEKNICQILSNANCAYMVKDGGQVIFGTGFEHSNYGHSFGELLGKRKTTDMSELRSGLNLKEFGKVGWKEKEERILLLCQKMDIMQVVALFVGS